MKRSKMKRLPIFLAGTCMTLIALTSFAKGQTGVYMTATEYENNKPFYTEKNKIHLNNSVLELPFITVMDHGQKHKIGKDEIYGYADNNKKTYRFFNGQEYQIAEAGPISIYIKAERIAQSKGAKVINRYYFSTSLNGELHQLTIDNVKKAYRSNEKFSDMLVTHFNSAAITSYDEQHGTYKVNYVYNKAMK